MDRIKGSKPLLLTLSMGIVIIVTTIIVITNQFTVNPGTGKEVMASPYFEPSILTFEESADIDVPWSSGTVFIGQKRVLVSDAYLLKDIEYIVEQVAVSDIGDEVTIYKISIPENTQRDIYRLSKENNLAYELVLAIYKIESDNKTPIDNIEAEIANLVYLRDYWAQQNYSDEIVFDLMLLSRHRGIEGSIIFMEENLNFYEIDQYILEVTEYKYYLNQI